MTIILGNLVKTLLFVLLLFFSTHLFAVDLTPCKKMSEVPVQWQTIKVEQKVDKEKFLAYHNAVARSYVGYISPEAFSFLLKANQKGVDLAWSKRKPDQIRKEFYTWCVKEYPQENGISS